MTLLPHPWLSARDLADAPGIRLFCFPHAGSGSAVYNRWQRLLPPAIRVCPVFLPGREMRLAEPCTVSAGRMAIDILDDLSPLLAQPYAIFGHSMGSLIGYELARQIEVARIPPPAALFCSGRNAPTQPAPHWSLHKLPDQEFVEALRLRYGGIPEGFLGDPTLREVFLPILRADLQLVERYRPPSGTLLRCPIWATAGTQDQTVSQAGLEAWSGLTASTFHTTRFPGHHFYHLAESQPPMLAWLTHALLTHALLT